MVSEKSKSKCSYVNNLSIILLKRLSASINFRSLAAIVFKQSTVYTSSYRKASVTKCDLTEKKVKINRDSSFEQTMMDPRPQRYILSFIEICPLVLKKKILKGVYHIRSWQSSWSSDSKDENIAFVPSSDGGST